MSGHQDSASSTSRPKKMKRDRLLRGSDIREAALMAFSLAVTRIGSPPLWTAAAERMATLGGVRRRRRYRRFAERVRAFYGNGIDEAEVRALSHACQAAIHRRRLATIAEWSQSPFAPEIAVEGADHVLEALRGGRGAILWLDNFINHQVIGKKGLHAVGFGGWQVSWTMHGFSSSRIGTKYLNPVQIAAEKRYVDGRIEFDADSTLAATRRIGRVLAENGIVRITNNAYIGRKFVTAPLGPNASISLATAPLNMSLKLGAPILPVATVEVRPLAQYRVVVAPPLEVSGDDPGFTRVAANYGAYLKPLIEQYPAQWRGWAGSLTAS
jgi:lauroyl/myristoyl acyltransferase